MKLASLIATAALLALPAPVVVAEEPGPKPPIVELSAQAAVEAANDRASAQAFFEATGAEPGPLAAQVNAVIAKAIATSKAYPGVSVRSDGTRSSPVYSRNGRSIDAWRMRSTLHLASADIEALSALIGELQGQLAVASMTLSPAPETRKKAEDAALVKALGEFEARAKLAADTLGRRYRIRRLNISQDHAQPPRPMYRAAMATAEAAPAPVVAGNSRVTVRISGSIELLD